MLPRDFKVRHGSERLVDIRSGLVRLKRSEFPNAGAVLMRVFFELAVTSFHETGQMKPLIEKLGGKGKLPYGVPQMKQMAPAITKIAKEKLDASEANKVEKALRYDAAAPFSVSELHAFIHQSGDLPIGHGSRSFFAIRSTGNLLLTLRRTHKRLPPPRRPGRAHRCLT